MKISAYYLAEQISLKALKDAYAGTLLKETPSELFYRVDQDQYMYVFDYGVAVFAQMPDVDVSKNKLLLQQFSLNPLTEKIFDDFEVFHRPGEPLKFHFDSLVVPEMDEKVIEIVMLSLAQSVALDFFSQRGGALLSDIRRFTTEMETKGAISISRKNMIRFIGRTLNNKNKIIENLFIFDTPEMIWDNEYLDKLHRGLARTFDLPSRFKEVEYTFKIVEDNLAVFRELYMHRESSQLEWIIIVLICIEVFDLIWSKFF